jgi:aldehyde:ferredoxin oxidoreductase
MWRRFLGGYGVGARVLFSHLKPGVDPLGPDNILGFCTGPLTGTPAVSGTRYTAVGKSPLTGGWGDANSGGFFGAYLRFAGYDAVFVRGVAEKPVYLLLDNGRAELRDASHLWGKDTYETEALLNAELGKETEVACIGPAGESRSLIAGIFHDRGRAAARSGLGAVMGSKRLKAVAARGNLAVPLADPERAGELRRRCVRELTGPVNVLRRYGTPAVVIPCAESADSPTRNWAGVAYRDFPQYRMLGGDEVVKRQVRRYACYRCPVGCGGHMQPGEGEYRWPPGVHKPEYETLAMFGSNCLNADLEAIIKVNDLCNRYGLDTISAGSAVAFAIECYENGLIDRGDTEGIEPSWGNSRAIVALVEKIARREGIGALLADGVKRAAEKIGRGAERYAVHVQGQEVPAHDPKSKIQFALAYRLDATPARHTQATAAPHMHPPGLLPPIDPRAQAGRGRLYQIGGNFNHAAVCLGMCHLVYVCLPNVEIISEFTRAVTGWDVDTAELLTAGERIANIRQAFNVREGLNPLEYAMPERLINREPVKAGPLAGMVIDEELMIREYLEAMDWDLKTAKPSRHKLEELGLEDVARELWP